MNPEDMSIDELDIPARAWNCLQRAGIKTVGELTQWRASSLLRLRQFGYQSLDEVERALAGLGLGLAYDDPKLARLEARQMVRAEQEQWH